MAMRINPNYSLIERSPSPPVSTDNAAIIDMEPETEKATTEQPAPEVPAISPAQPSPPPPQIRLEDKPLTYAQREELQSIFKRMSLPLSPRLQKKARRRQQLNSIRAVIFFTVWLIQSSYVFRQVFKSLYRMIKAWVVKDCAKHAQKVAAAAATADTKEVGNNVIWTAIGTTVPVIIVVWYFIYRLVAPLRSTGRYVFFEGCAACFVVFQASTGAILVGAQYAENGYFDWYNTVNATLFLVLLVLTAIISASYLEEVEYLSWDMKAEALDAPKEAVGDSKV